MRYDLSEIKKQDIVEVARELGFEVKNGAMRCFNPGNHRNLDEHPSLTFGNRNTFRCWVCPDLHGDVIAFVRLARNLSFPQAVKFLAERVCLRPSEGNPPSRTEARPEQSKVESAKPGDKGDHNEYTEVYDSVYELCAEPPPNALAWLGNRGISAETAVRQKVRFVQNVPQILEALLGRFPIEQLRQSGLLNKHDKLIFSGHRLIWPYICNGKVVYLQGRSLDPNKRPKEICLARPVPCPYNVDVLKPKPETVFVCEGCLDTLALLERRLCAVGIPGAAGFKQAWIPLFSGIHVKVALDADPSGNEHGAELVKRLREAGIKADRVYLPNGYDVNQFMCAMKQFVN